MLTAEKRAKVEVVSANGCCECQGTGLIHYRSEFSYFEDRRRCPHCDAGRRLGSTIADIIARVQLEDHTLGR